MMKLMTIHDKLMSYLDYIIYTQYTYIFSKLNTCLYALIGVD
jgi:hypothetical protein